MRCGCRLVNIRRRNKQMKAFIHADLYGRKEDAFLIDGERFCRFGTSEEIEAQLAAEDELTDLHGAFVSPGFHDSHCHLLEFGRYLENVPLHSCRSTEEVCRLLSRRLSELPEGSWLAGRGFNEESFEVPGMPERKDLDAVSKDVPIVVTRICGHKMVVNSKALELAGMDENTVMEGGIVDAEHGFLEETAVTAMHNVMPDETEESIRRSILRGQKELNRYGITAVGSDDFVSLADDWRLVLKVFSSMAYKGELTVRVNEQCEFPSLEEYAKFLDEGYTTDVGDDLFRIGPLKLITDGSLGARTAALKEPYSDDPQKIGYLLMPLEELQKWVELGARFNMPSICHAIGDEAVASVLDLLEEVNLPGNPLHHGLVHCQIMSEDEIQKAIDMHLDCYFQSLFIDDDSAIVFDRVGAKRAEHSYPFKTLYEHVIACNGSDAPVELPNVMKGIELAVTRKSIATGDSMNPSECLSVAQALDSYTVKGAEANAVSDRYGSLKEGLYADFAVLSENPLNCDVTKIHEIRVLMTVMNGETVYENEGGVRS